MPARAISMVNTSTNAVQANIAINNLWISFNFMGIPVATISCNSAAARATGPRETPHFLHI
jgi:hypothetical protein